jgi:hypothetical protein
VFTLPDSRHNGNPEADSVSPCPRSCHFGSGAEKSNRIFSQFRRAWSGAHTFEGSKSGQDSHVDLGGLFVAGDERFDVDSMFPGHPPETIVPYERGACP